MSTIDPRASTADTRACLVCRVRHTSVAIPIERVVEILRPLPIAPIAGMPACVAGLSVVRGEPTPVVDVGALLHRDHAPAWRRFVRVSTGSDARPLVLAVEAVLGVHALADTMLRDLPGVLGSAAVESIGVHERRLLLVLATARVLPPDVWDAIAAEVRA